jgi:Amino acid kinase family
LLARHYHTDKFEIQFVVQFEGTMRGRQGEAALPALGDLLLDRSLDEEAVLRATEATPDYPILPWANVIKIGGQSLIDRGRAAVYPLLDEIVANLGRRKMILGTGAGTRARHIYALAISLGLPTGVLTVLGTAVAWQNAQMLHYLLARYGIPFVEPEGFSILPHYLMERGAVVCQGMPPYKLWEQNPAVGRIPPQRTDTGCFLIAEVSGARKMIYVKDEDGLFDLATVVRRLIHDCVATKGNGTGESPRAARQVRRRNSISRQECRWPGWPWPERNGARAWDFRCGRGVSAAGHNLGPPSEKV